MFRPYLACWPRELAKWCMCALVLLAPGSFVVLPVLWLVRQFRYSRGMPAGKLDATPAIRESIARQGAQ